jgi:hypothetical protein
MSTLKILQALLMKTKFWAKSEILFVIFLL